MKKLGAVIAHLEELDRNLSEANNIHEVKDEVNARNIHVQITGD